MKPLRDHIDGVVAKRLAQRACFSSGEIAADLRQQDPAPVFSVLTVGEILRAMFREGAFGGDYTQLTQVTRGRYRTPAGVLVNVYGPPEAVESHEFEVFVPQWSNDLGRYTTEADEPPAAPVADPSDMGARSSLPDCDVTLRVWPDQRVCIPQNALEELSARQGVAVALGAEVYYQETDTFGVISLVKPPPMPGEDYRVLTITNHERVAVRPTRDLPLGFLRAKVGLGGVRFSLT